MLNDPFKLKRFVDAQDAPYFAGATMSTYDGALAELSAGAKLGHWIWFIFPQLTGLGHSYMSELYGLNGVPEARAYFAHSVLAPRLIACVDALLSHGEKSATDILGPLDALKLQSSMTLFSLAAPLEPRFRQALAQFFWSKKDKNTLDKLGAW